MAFGKTFVLSLVTFLGLNFVFAIIIAALSDSIGTFFPDLVDPLSNLAGALFGPIAVLPGTVAASIPIVFVGPFDLGILLGLIFFIVAPLLAAIIAGRLGESRGECFGAWFLVAMVSMGVYLILILVAEVLASLLIFTIVLTIIAGLINGFFYGCFALLFAKSEIY